MRQAPAADGATVRDTLYLRFEDVTQDGRLVLEALPPSLQPLWQLFARNESFRGVRERGIVPILTRFVLEGAAGPFSATSPVTVEAAYRVLRSDDGYLRLDMTATLSAVSARTYDLSPPPRPTQAVPPPDFGRAAHRPTARRAEQADLSPGGPPAETAGDAPKTTAGRVFAEHAFTRPFAPAGRRRVAALDFEGAPEVRDVRPALEPAEHLFRLPQGARSLDAEPLLEAVPVTFGLVHTDSNMHVNSLAYLRVFEEAALRRFVALGRGALWLGRRLEIAYRKPCFAGQRMRMALQAFELDGRLGVVGALVEDPALVQPEGAGSRRKSAAAPDPAPAAAVAPLAPLPAGAHARARTIVRMLFEP